MNETSDLVFALSVLLPALALLSLVAGRKYVEALEGATGRVPPGLSFLEHARFEWALFGATGLLLCAALTGSSAYAFKTGNPLLGAGSGIIAALLARASARLPVEPDDLNARTRAALLPLVVLAAVGIALSQFYAPAMPA